MRASDLTGFGSQRANSSELLFVSGKFGACIP